MLHGLVIKRWVAVGVKADAAFSHLLSAFCHHLAFHADGGAVQDHHFQCLYHWGVGRCDKGLGFGLVGFRKAVVHLVAVVVFRAGLQTSNLNGIVLSVYVGIKSAGIDKVVPLPYLHFDAIDLAVIGIHACDGDSSRGIAEVFPFKGDRLDVGVVVLLAGKQQCGQGDGQGCDA